MKRYLIIGLISLFIVIIAVFIVLNVNSCFSRREERKMINFQLHGSYAVDTSGIRKRMMVADGTPFTFFIQIRNFDNLEEYFLKEYKLEIPYIEFNYENSYMAVTFGREIEELAYSGYLGEPFTPNTFPKKVELTFAEEYTDQIMYVYEMDKLMINLISLNGVHADDQCKIFLMKEDEKVFWGNSTSDINKKAPSGGPGL
jgi:hypothetical protein